VFWQLIGDDLAAHPTTDNATAQKVRELETERARLIKARDEYRDDPDIQSALPPRAYADGLQIRQRRIDEVDRAIGEAVAKRPALNESATTLRARWETLDVQTRRRMLHAAIGAVVVAPPRQKRDHSEPLAQRARLLLPPDLPANLPRPGRYPVALASFPSFDDPACAWISLTEPAREDRSDRLTGTGVAAS
jgi:hypothetical protein